MTTPRIEELWREAAELIRAQRGWSLRPLAQLGYRRPGRCVWLTEGELGAVVVKARNDPSGLRRAPWTSAVLTDLSERGYPVPRPLWLGTLRSGWWIEVQERLPGVPVDVLDDAVLDQIFGLIDLQVSPGVQLTDGGWDVSSWVSSILFEGWEHWWETAEVAAPAISRRLHAFLAPAAGRRLPLADIVHGDYNLTNVLVTDRVVSGVIDWDHAGLGSRAVDLASLLFEWHRLHLSGREVAVDGHARIVARIITVAGDAGLRSAVTYGAVARLALSAQRRKLDDLEQWRMVTEGVLDSLAGDRNHIDES